MSYAKILYELDDHVAVVRMNDPDTLNAMSPEMGEELLDALGRATHEARAIVLGGVGRGFCSGANLAGGGVDVDDPHRDMGRQLDQFMNPIVSRIRLAEVPVVTAVRGPAAGIGCAYALAGDLIVAGEQAYFLQAFRQIGLVPDGGSSYLLTRAVGRTRAMEMMLLGTRVPARQALDWGLVNRVVAEEEVDATALALARELAQGPRALGMIKRVAWSALDASFETVLANERNAQREAGRTDDFAEGVAAFLGKRKPAFKGR